jgi:3-oxosteroid 1-dehydrogenase
MATRWDKSVDLAIVGSGGGGLIAAMAAAEAGLEALVLEKQSVVGGSTGMSGGMVWMPNNPLMRAGRIADSHEDGLAYLADVVGDVGPCSSPARREMFLRAGNEMITFMQRKGIRLVRSKGYSDYYPNHDGGNASGRAVEGVPFDAAELGEWRDRLQPGFSKNFGLGFLTNELRNVQYFNRSPRSLAIAARVFARTVLARARRQELLTNGASLVGQIMKVLLADGVSVWTDAPVDDLVVEDGRVVGIRMVGQGTTTMIEAKKGVLLAAGGFSHNPAMRRKYGGDQPNDAQWSIANAGDTGEVLETAMGLGAKTDLLDEAWWLPSPTVALGASSLGAARQRPGTIFVDAAGRRFCNESNSYVEVGKAMYADGAVPCWLIFDDAYRRRYSLTAASLPGRMPQEWIDKGLVRKAATVEDLARQIGVDPTGLARTLTRFNANAVKGTDPDFGRGESAYNDCLGDPGYRPNACLGPLDEAPFYATEIYPSDVGTCGGLLTNEYAQVLDQSDTPIPGLYATGNITATVMGRTYPGAGASIANTMVFGFVAARHAVGRLTPERKYRGATSL